MSLDKKENSIPIYLIIIINSCIIFLALLNYLIFGLIFLIAIIVDHIIILISNLIIFIQYKREKYDFFRSIMSLLMTIFINIIIIILMNLYYIGQYGL